MQHDFSVDIVDFQVLEQMPNTWQQQDFLALLDEMEFAVTDDISAHDIEEFCLMCLQDMKPAEAAGVVLRYRMRGKLSTGQIDNLASDMLDEKMWEEFADFALHEELFNVGSLLRKAFPAVFPEPDAIKVTFTVEAMTGDGRKITAGELSESFLIRLLADGMDDDAVLHRLFDDKIRGRRFEEASTIIWTVETARQDDNVVSVAVISSGYWLDALRGTKRFQSSAYPDED